MQECYLVPSEYISYMYVHGHLSFNYGSNHVGTVDPGRLIFAASETCICLGQITVASKGQSALICTINLLVVEIAT